MNDRTKNGHEPTTPLLKRVISLLCLSLFFWAAAEALHPAFLSANGDTPPGERRKDEDDPCAELRERVEKLEAEKKARQKRAAEARKRAAAAAKKKEAEKKAAEAKQREAEAKRAAREAYLRETLLAGRNLVEEGRYRGAIDVLKPFLVENPGSADGWYWIARAHHALGDYERAQNATNNALRIDPQYPLLAKTPNGIQPMPKLTKQQMKEPRPSMSVLPVKQPMPVRIALEPVTISFPRLVPGDKRDAETRDTRGNPEYRAYEGHDFKITMQADGKSPREFGYTGPETVYYDPATNAYLLMLPPHRTASAGGTAARVRAETTYFDPATHSYLILTETTDYLLPPGAEGSGAAFYRAEDRTYIIVRPDGERVFFEPVPEGSEPGSYDPNTGAYLLYEPYPPLTRAQTVHWQQSERFNEISRWRFRVDRMAILTHPRVPIAWKGLRPYEVYFWTGSEWARVRRQREGFASYAESYDEILARAQEDIASVLRERGFSWRESDTPALAACASLMRYAWQGDIDLRPAKKRVHRDDEQQEARKYTDEMQKLSNEN